MEIMLKNKCCLYVIISIRFFQSRIVTYLLNFPRTKGFKVHKGEKSVEMNTDRIVLNTEEY